MTKNKRPIPTVKSDAELENLKESFINDINPKTQTNEINTPQEQKTNPIYVKKSLVLKAILDDALRLESAKTKIKQITIMEEAIAEYLRKKGYENI